MPKASQVLLAVEYDREPVPVRDLGHLVRADADQASDIYLFVKDYKSPKDLLAQIATPSEWDPDSLRDDINDRRQAWYVLQSQERQKLGVAVIKTSNSPETVAVNVLLDSSVPDLMLATHRVLVTLTQHAITRSNARSVLVLVKDQELATLLLRQSTRSCRFIKWQVRSDITILKHPQ